MTTPITGHEHDQALDYLYGMLEGDEKARFEAHLAGCARCQAELEANGRVRAVAKSVLPSIEPSERLTGALHAQLLHEASKRPAPGKVLPFVRRIVRHPGYAAAAGLLLIGGAVGVQWSRGKLLMPAPEAAAPVTQAAAPPPPPAEPPAPIAAAPSKAKLSKATPADETTVAEDQQQQEYAKAVRSPAPTPAHEPAPSKKRDVAPFAKQESMLKDESYAEESNGTRGRGPMGGLPGGVIGGKGGGVDGLLERKPASPPAKPAPYAAERAEKADDAAGYGSLDRRSAPRAVGAKEAESKRANLDQDAEGSAALAQTESAAPRRESNARSSGGGQAQPVDKSAYGDVAPAPAPSQAPPSVAQNDAPMMPSNAAASGTASQSNAVPSAAAPSNAMSHHAAQSQVPSQDGLDVERGRAASFAQEDRCAEAVKLYGAIDRRAPDRLSSQDRLSYARCLRMLGRVVPAQNELDQVAGKLPSPAVAAEQQALNLERHKMAAPRAKASKRNADTNANQNDAPSKK